MLERLRQWLFRRALRQLLAAQQRRRRPHTFSSALTVGILFEATSEKIRKEVLDLATSLRKKGKTVRLLGFVDIKKEPAAIESKPDFDIFTRKEMTWTGRPKGEKVEAFGQQKFDLLLSLNPEEKLPLDWLAVQSPAAMKIGMATEHLNDFDLALDTPRGQGLRFFMEQLNHYLDKIVLTTYEPAKAH